MSEDGKAMRRWLGAAVIALLLHGPLLLGGGVRDTTAHQASSGTARGAGDDRDTVIEIAFRSVAAGPDGAAPATTPAPRGQAVRQQGGGGHDGYYARLRAHLQRFRRPPAHPAGADAALHGTAVVAFDVGANGQLSGIRLQHSAGDAALDAEALALAHRASPVPRPPQGVPLSLSVPVVFE